MNATLLQLPETNSAERTLWAIDPIQSSIEFSIKLMGLAAVHGRFGGFQGAIQYIGDCPASIEARIDTATIETGIEKRDEHLRSVDFFDVAVFPTISFHSKRIEPVGVLHHDHWRVVGLLTIHGVTRPVELVANRTDDGPNPIAAEATSFEAITRVNRKDFGVGVKVPLNGSGLVIGDEVTIKISVRVVRNHKSDR